MPIVQYCTIWTSVFCIFTSCHHLRHDSAKVCKQTISQWYGFVTRSSFLESFWSILCRLPVSYTITAIFSPCLNQWILPCWQTWLITIPKAIWSNQCSGSDKYMQILRNWDLPDNGTFWVNSPLTNGHCGEWRSCSDLIAISSNNKVNNTSLLSLLLHLLMHLKITQSQHLKQLVCS